MSKLTLNDVTNIGSITVINDNFDKIEQELQTKVLYRNNPSGESNTMENDIDMNGKNILNVGDVFSSVGRWATIDEVEDARAEVASNTAAVAINTGLAVSSASAATTAYDNFDDRYLGQKASDPSADNDGGFLLTGALYFRTSGTPIMRVYNGTTWQDVGSITSTTTNLIDPTLYSSQSEAEAGDNNTKVITPLRAKNAIDAQVKGGFTSTGPIILPGNAATALAAVPRQQLDQALSDRFFTASTSLNSGSSKDLIDLVGFANARKITFFITGSTWATLDSGVLTNTGLVIQLMKNVAGVSSVVETGYEGARVDIATGEKFFQSTGFIGGPLATSPRSVMSNIVFTKIDNSTWAYSGNHATINSSSAFSRELQTLTGFVTAPDLAGFRITHSGTTLTMTAGTLRVVVEK